MRSIKVLLFVRQDDEDKHWSLVKNSFLNILCFQTFQPADTPVLSHMEDMETKRGFVLKRMLAGTTHANFKNILRSLLLSRN